MANNENKYLKRWNSPSAKAKYMDLEEMLELKGNFLCVVEEPYGIPFQESDEVPRIKDINYGHVVGVINSADKNEWDIIFPSSNCALNMVICDKIVGYVHDSKGNHKLIGICYSAPQSSYDNFMKNLKKYINKRRSVYDQDCVAYIFDGAIDEIKGHYTEY